MDYVRNVFPVTELYLKLEVMQAFQRWLAAIQAHIYYSCMRTTVAKIGLSLACVMYSSIKECNAYNQLYL